MVGKGGTPAQADPAPVPADVPWNRRAAAALLVLLAALALARGLPFRLEKSDQAKQAYASLQIASGGSFWFPHTPDGQPATKPPGVAWLSLWLHALWGSWPVAWVLPGLAATAALAALVWAGGRRLAPPDGGLLAAIVFGSNLLTLRLATLVRTDMVLALLCVAAIALPWRAARSARPLSPRERFALGLVMAAAWFTKGPVFLAFVLPALAALVFVHRGERGWPDLGGAWPWLLPAALFGVWVVAGMLSSPDFTDRVVVGEFAERFSTGGRRAFEVRPPWYYVLPFLHRAFPWSIVLIAGLLHPRVRRAAWRSSDFRFLLLAALGGFLVMSFVPSKRIDRVYPAVPLLALALPTLVLAATRELGPARVRRLGALALGVTAINAAGYVGISVGQDLWEGAAELRTFARSCQARTGSDAPGHFAVVGVVPESTLVYTRLLERTGLPSARAGWSDGTLTGVIADAAAERTLTATPPRGRVISRIRWNERDFACVQRESGAGSSPARSSRRTSLSTPTDQVPIRAARPNSGTE